MIWFTYINIESFVRRPTRDRTKPRHLGRNPQWPWGIGGQFCWISAACHRRSMYDEQKQVSYTIQSRQPKETEEAAAIAYVWWHISTAHLPRGCHRQKPVGRGGPTSDEPRPLSTSVPLLLAGFLLLLPSTICNGQLEQPLYRAGWVQI